MPASLVPVPVHGARPSTETSRVVLGRETTPATLEVAVSDAIPVPGGDACRQPGPVARLIITPPPHTRRQTPVRAGSKEPSCSSPMPPTSILLTPRRPRYAAP